MTIISNYTELQDEVASLCHRESDTAFVAKIPLFIKLAETRFNRDLRTVGMQETLASTALVSGAASLPAGFRAFKELRFNGNPSYTLQPKSLEWIRSQNSADADDARYFAVTGSEVVCWPTTGPIAGTYFEEIPPLADNSTNWLLTAHPDLYLFAASVEAAVWGYDDSRLPIWAERTKATIDMLNREDERNQFDGGILAVRAR